MASDEGMTALSSMQEEEFGDTDDGYDHHQHHHLSRLSMCTSSMYTNEDDDDDDNDEVMKMYISRLSIESFDGDADEEFSDEKEFKGLLPELSSDSDKDPGCYSLPATPRRRRARRGSVSRQQLMGVKDYASENEVEKGMLRQKMKRNLRNRRITNSNNNEFVNKKYESNDLGFSGESDHSGGCGSGLVVITKPKGGRRSLCMGMEEMKACRDLGFELEHEHRVSLSGSTLDTASSGSNSPISNWRISSPGDDPRDVKARLKVWAQAVALASTSRHSS